MISGEDWIQAVGLVLPSAQYVYGDALEWLDERPQPSEAELVAALDAEEVRRLEAQIDAEAVRARYITPGSGQAMVYSAKQAAVRAAAPEDREAVAIVAWPSPPG